MNRHSLIRRCASLVYQEGRVYRVPLGPLRGVKLRYEAQVNVREMLGLWEKQSFAIVARLQRAGLFGNGGDVAYDVGANFGLYAIYLARHVVPRGQVYAFEPADVPRQLMVCNVGVNGLANVTVEAKACSAVDGEVEFFLSANHHTSSLERQRACGEAEHCESARVASVTLDSHWRDAGQQGRQIVLVKMDIEGGGTQALKGCAEIARSQRCYFLIESHSPGEDAAIGTMMQTGGYCGYRTTNRRWVMKPDRVHPDPDGVWGTVLLVPNECEGKARTALGN